MNIFKIITDKEKLFESLNIYKSSNIGIIKCYYLLLTKNGMLKSIGSYILIITNKNINNLETIGNLKNDKKKRIN